METPGTSTVKRSTSSRNDSVIPAEDVRVLLKYIRHKARQYGHPGHSMLNQVELFSLGQEILSQLLRQTANQRLKGKNPCTDIPWLKSCLRRRFTQDVFDLRKAWCLSQSRGRQTLQISHLEAVTQGEWSPTESMYSGSTTYDPEQNQDVTDAFLRIQERLNDAEWCICHALYILGCDTAEIEVMFDVSKDVVRHTLDRVNAMLHSTLGRRA